jgi:hypothetical protein
VLALRPARTSRRLLSRLAGVSGRDGPLQRDVACVGLACAAAVGRRAVGGGEVGVRETPDVVDHVVGRVAG